MPQISQEEEKTYQKRIDELIEDAEIEAEIESEKKLRSKNTRLLTISLVAIALIAFIFLEVKTGSKATSPGENEAGPLPELASGPVTDQTPDSKAPGQTTPPSQAPTDESNIQATSKEKPKRGVTSTQAKKSKTSGSTVPVKSAETKTLRPAAQVEKPKEPVVAQAPPKAPIPRPVEKTKAAEIVKQPTKSSSSKATSAKQYHIQLGVFSVEENAKKLSKSISAKGFNPSIQTKSINPVRHVVFVGGFSNKDDGAQAFKELKAKGFDPVMEKFKDNSHTIILGKFKKSRQAEALRDKLSIHGFLSSTKKSRVQSNIHIVQLGPFESLPQAKKAQKNIGRAGFNNSFIR